MIFYLNTVNNLHITSLFLVIILFYFFQDELTTLNVKHGFATMPQLTDEFGTARNCNITASKVRKCAIMFK